MTSKSPKAPPIVGEIERVEGDVGEPRGRRRLARHGDRRFGEIDADELGAGRAERHGDQVDALAAADLEHSRGAERTDLAAGEGGDRADRGRVGLGVDLARIADPIEDVGHERPP